jgi:hypothetical protein
VRGEAPPESCSSISSEALPHLGGAEEVAEPRIGGIGLDELAIDFCRGGGLAAGMELLRLRQQLLLTEGRLLHAARTLG